MFVEYSIRVVEKEPILFHHWNGFAHETFIVLIYLLVESLLSKGGQHFLIFDNQS